MLLNWFFYYAASLAEALSENADVLLVTMEQGRELSVGGDASSAKRDLLDDRAKLAIIHGRRWGIATVASTHGCCRALREFEPHVLHVQDHADWRLWVLQRAVGRVPVLTTVHDVSPHTGSAEHRDHVQLWVHSNLLRRTDAFIVHGQDLASELRGKPWWLGQPVFIAPHGVLAHPCDARRLP